MVAQRPVAGPERGMAAEDGESEPAAGAWTPPRAPAAFPAEAVALAGR